MAGFETAIAHENEIMKAEDVTFSYNATINNVAAALQSILTQSGGNYVIGGTVKPYSGAGALQVSIDPLYAFCAETGISVAETAATAPVSLEAADASFDRIDIIQVKGQEDGYDQQSRMFNDPLSGTKTLRTVATKSRIKLIVQAKTGAANSESAPSVDSGFIKLAEIKIPANVQAITPEMIFNVEARKGGVENQRWTADKANTFNPGYLAETFYAFLLAHNEDGSHRARTITRDNIAFGTGNNEVKGSLIPSGQKISLHGKDFSQTADLTSLIASLAESSNNLYNYANNILSRYSYVSILPVAASTAPIDIKGGGEKTIDGVACKAGMTVFLKDQTDARENGLYIVKAGAWARATGFTEGSSFIHQLIFIPAGTVNKGKIFYLDADFITLGQDKLAFKASALSPYALANTVMTRDKDGRAKVAAPNAADDIARKAEVDAEARARADAVGREANARTDADFAEKNARIEADRILADTRMTRTQCEDIARSAVGKIPAAGQGDSTDKDKNKGLGLVKTANRAPNMQEASKNESWAASPNWVFNLITGNCEAELKKHIINAMRSGVKSDPGVFCYRGTIKSGDLNKTTTSGIYTVSYGPYSGALLVFDASGSTGYIQFLKNNWLVDTPWQYRNAVDGDINRWNAWRSIATSEEVASHTNNKSNPHGVTKEQLGLGNVDNTRDNEKSVRHAESADRADEASSASAANAVKDYAGGRDIQIGYNGASLTAEEINFLAAYKDATHIKDVNRTTVKEWLGINNVDNTRDNEKFVRHAKSADRADEASSASVANAVKDYAGGRDIQIGFAGASLKSEDVNYLAAFSGGKIKDIHKDEAKKLLGVDTVSIENAGWKACIRPCANGVELVILGGDGGEMKKQQLWTRIAGGVMSLFVLGSITSCGGMYQGNTGAVKNSWEKIVSNTSALLRSVACNENTWIAVGYHGATRFSRDNGQSWDLPYPVIYTAYNSVSYDGGIWIAVGVDGTIVVSADSGNSWTKKNSGTYDGITGIATNGNTWIAVGVDGTIVASTDNGDNWTKKNSGTDKSLFGIAYNNHTWIAVGAGGTIVVSTDNGNNWTEKYRNTTYPLRGIACNGNTWIAVGAGGTIVASTDNGDNWTKKNSGTDKSLFGIAYNNHTWIAVGDGGTILRSSDTAVWK